MKLPETEKIRTEINTGKICSLKKVYNDAGKLRTSVLKHNKRYGEELLSVELIDLMLKNINEQLKNIAQSDKVLINGGLCVI